ncbi:MAG: pilus assembly protein PilM [Sumerlaeia bacterium]
MPLKKCLGVDLGSNTVKIVELALERNGVRVLRAASAETGVDPSMPSEERRAIISKTARDLIRGAKMGTKDAVFVLPGQKVFIRRFRLPETSPERLERIINYEARQQIPFPLDKTDLQFQFFPIPEDKEVEVLLVAVRHDEVNDFMTMVDKTGLKPRLISVSSFAVFNAQAYMARPAAAVVEALNPRKAKSAKKTKGKKNKKKKGEDVADEDILVGGEGDEEALDEEFVFEEVKGFVNVGAVATDLVVARQQGDKSLPGFFRSFPVAGNEITRNIMEDCGIESFTDAEGVKRHQTRLMTFDFDFDEGGDTNRDACGAATDAVDRLVNEIRRSLDFYISQPDGQAVDFLLVSGGQANLPGMDTYIEEKLTITTSVLSDVPEDTALQWPNPGESMAAYAPAIGAALQGIGMGGLEVDFLPRERKITRDFPYKTAAILAVLLLGVLFFAAQAGEKYMSLYSQETAALENVMLQRREQDLAAREADQQNVAVAKLYEDFAKGVTQRDYWLEFLANINRLKPPEVVIDRVEADHDGNFEIVGVSETERSSADFAKAMQESMENFMREPEITRSAQTRDPRFPDRQTVYRFVIEGEMQDKINILNITPTPTPTPTGGPQGFRPGIQGQGGSRNNFAPGRGF